MQRKLLILNLGDFVTPDQNAGILALVDLLKSRAPALENEMLRIMVISILKENNDAIEKFNLGGSEAVFNRIMVDAIKAKTKINVTVAEFDDAWSQMNPTYFSCKEKLDQVAAFNEAKNQQAIFISATNVKDMRQLSESKKACIPNSMGNIFSIRGIQVITTCAYKKSKAALIEDLVRQLQTQKMSPAKLSSYGRYFSKEKAPAPWQIYYVLGTTKFVSMVDTLQKYAEKTSAEVTQVAAKFEVETLVWNKQKQTFSEFAATEVVKDKAYKASVMQL